ncbi:MAG TPA: NAD-dependent epimerase/dehydratase family protein [Acidimicrobiales bacterium]
MRALVTGGAGFIGSHLVDRLLAEGHTVDVVDDLSGGSLANLASARADATRTGGELKFHHVDVRSPDVVDLVVRRRPDVVFHLVVPAPGLAERVATDLVFAAATAIIDASLRAGAAKLVVGLDAADLYGAVPSAELPVKDGRAWQPQTSVGVAERAVADLLAVTRERHDLEFTGLAFSNVYGPRQPASRGVVAAFTTAAATGTPAVIQGDGRQTRDFLYVDDAVDACVRAAQRGGGLVVNVGTGTQTTIRELHQRIAVGGPPATFTGGRQGEIGRFAVSPARARIHLAWAPWTSLDEGLAQVRRHTS